MKTKAKTFAKVIAFLAIIGVIALILLIPGVSRKVSEVTNIAEEKIRNVAGAIVGIAVGLILIAIGATASIALVGIPLVIIGLAMVYFAVAPLFEKSTMTVSSGGLNKFGTGQ
jgi:hypothetical protein